MDIAGLLDDVAELAKKRNWTEKALGGGIRGATLRGLLGFDAPEDATSTEKEAWRTGQALSNTPTPLALAVAPAALVKASKTTKALPQEKALETARQNAVKMLGLPESNTAMDRAKAMGFDTEAFHGTKKTERSYAGSGVGDSSVVVSRGDDSLRGRSDNAAIRSLDEGSTWFHKDPSQAFASGEGAYVIPSLIRMRNPIFRTSYFGMEDFSNPAKYKYFDKQIQKFVTPDGVVGENGVVVAFNPNQVRSRFAAFDPARIDEKDLLAGLAALGIGVPMISGLLQEQE